MQTVTSAQMRELEAAANARGLSYDEMMRRAGAGVADHVLHLLEGKADPRVLVLIGPGNNGGDGLVCARQLAAKLDPAHICLYIWKRNTNPAAESDWPLGEAIAAGLPIYLAARDYHQEKLNDLLYAADIVVDALLGTGQHGPFPADLEDVLGELLNVQGEMEESRPPLVAVDIPTGIDADTGAAISPDYVRANLTCTFAYLKPGLLQGEGAKAAGKVEVLDIGILDFGLFWIGDVQMSNWQDITPDWVARLLPERKDDANKGSFGKCLVVAGSINYTGAAYLATSAAMRVGAGLTTLATAGDLLELFQIKLTESTFLPLPTDMGVIATRADEMVAKAIADKGYNVLLLGPGIGQEKETQAFVYRLLGVQREAARSHKANSPGLGFNRPATNEKKSEGKEQPSKPALPDRMVLDADGLNAVAALDGDKWWEHLPAETVLTPHPGELARLLGKEYSAESVQRDRAAAIGAAVRRFGHTIILKGAHTLIASAEGGQVRYARSDYASALLATAGSGDVLAGIIAGLLAQGLTAPEAAVAGVYLHARAAQLGAESMGLSRAVGLLAGDLLMYIPLALSVLE